MSEDEAHGPVPSGPPLDQTFRLVLDALFDHVTVAEAMRDQHGRIVDFAVHYVNESLVDGAGRSGAEVAGRRLLELFPASKDTGPFDILVGVVETGQPYVEDHRLFHEDVEPERAIDGYWSLSVAKFGDGYLAASRDVTALVADEQERRREHLERERSRAAVACLQQAALPTRLPVIEGLEIAACYQPAMDRQAVGGDWYDLFDLGDDRLGVVIADVAGHGPEAAAFMLQVRNVVRSFAFEYVDPTTVLEASNRMVARLDEPDLFATCCYAIVDRSALEVSWASAGHLPPLLLGGTSRYLRGPVGPPLGTEPDARFLAHTEALAVGDRLVLFTDGLVEQRGTPIAESLDALLHSGQTWHGLDAETTLERLVATAVERSDDLAAVCVRVMGVDRG